MPKKVSIAIATNKPKPSPSADDWVSSNAEMTRFVIDIPTDLHRVIKADCALRGRKMAEEVRQVLAERYAKKITVSKG